MGEYVRSLGLVEHDTYPKNHDDRHIERVSCEQGSMTSVQVEHWGNHRRNDRYWAGYSASLPPGRRCGLSPELPLERKQSRFLSLTLLLVCALGNPPSRMLLIQTHNALEQALLVGSEFLQPCTREGSQRHLHAAVMPSLIERGYNP